MGLKSGEWGGGRHNSRVPYFCATSFSPVTVCTDKLSGTSTSPGTSVGPGTWSGVSAARFVHEDNAREPHFLNGFHKQSLQRDHPLRAAFGGADAFLTVSIESFGGPAHGCAA